MSFGFKASRACMVTIAVTMAEATGLPRPAAAETMNQAATAEPIVLLKGEAIAACGMRAAGAQGPEIPQVEVLVVRDGDRALFEIASAGGPGPLPTTLRILTPDFDTIDHFPPLAASPEGRVSARAALEATAGARLMQSLMVLGGTAEIGYPDGTAVRLDLPRPMPQSVRAAYLNCAGDLFRP